MTISKECAELGEKLLNSREILQTALDLTAHAKRPEDVVSSELAKDMIRQAKDLSREVELPKEEGMRLEVSFASALDSIKKSDYDTAVSHILKARTSLLDLTFQQVVACECSTTGSEGINPGFKIAPKDLVKAVGHWKPAGKIYARALKLEKEGMNLTEAIQVAMREPSHWEGFEHLK